MGGKFAGVRDHFVAAVYANHNQSRQVHAAVQRCVAQLGWGERGLNVGSSDRRLHPAIMNYDLVHSVGVDCVGNAENLPFADHAFSLIISQETLEHVRDPFRAMREAYRVTRPGGLLYCQVPFVIGYHPGPTDYWRFTREGIREVIEQAGYRCTSVAVTVGPAIGLYRIAVEFFATLAARFTRQAYHPAKAAFALILYPLKWTDALLLGSDQVDRVAGGYYAIGIKPALDSSAS